MTRKDTTIYSKERRLVFVSLSILFAMFVGYIFFVSASVVHVVVRKEIDQEIVKVNSRLSDLEVAYINAKDAVGAELVEARGFVYTGERIFINRAPTSLVLSRNDESR